MDEVQLYLHQRSEALIKDIDDAASKRQYADALRFQGALEEIARALLRFDIAEDLAPL
jgi:hypothetical protein